MIWQTMAIIMWACYGVLLNKTIDQALQEHGYRMTIWGAFLAFIFAPAHLIWSAFDSATNYEEKEEEENDDQT